MANRIVKLTERQQDILLKLYKDSSLKKVATIDKNQNELAEEFGITRQALSNHLKVLKEKGFLKTGRGFIDLSDKALDFLRAGGEEAFIFVKIEPVKRNKAFEKIGKLDVLRCSLVTGSIDVIVMVEKGKVQKILDKVSEIDGVIETNTHMILKDFERV